MASETNPPTLERNTIGGYRLRAALGSGGMGHVYEAEPVQGGAPVALKLIQVGLEEFSDRPRKLLDEARLGASFQHPNLVRILDVGADGPCYFLVMELLEGFTLSRLLGVEKRLPPPLVVELGRQALAGMAAMHGFRNAEGTLAPVLHRDIKPSNLFVTTQGVLKIIDFGIALLPDVDRTRTDTGQLRGSLPYCSPEQAAAKPLDARSDLFSLGLVLYEALSGSRVFSQRNDAAVLSAVLFSPIEPLREVCPELPERLCAAVDAALVKQPEQRIATAEAFAQALVDSLPAEQRWGEGDVRLWLQRLPPLSSPGIQRATAPLMLPRLNEAASRLPETSPGSGKQRPRRLIAVAAATTLVGLAAGIGLQSLSGRGAEPGRGAEVEASRPAAADGSADTVPAASARAAAPGEGEGAASADPTPALDAGAPSPTLAKGGGPVAPEAVAAAPVAPGPQEAAPGAAAPRKPASRAEPTKSTRNAVARGMGWLTVDSRPFYGRVELDGRSIGITPIYRQRVPSGRHTVRVVRDDGSSRREAVTVEPEKSATVIVKW